MEAYSEAVSGGILIGVASWILLAGAGRISGVSSITSGVLTSKKQSSLWRWAFLFGLVGGGALFTWLLATPAVELRSAFMLIPAGFMVGFGTVLGSGCTSGHGVCGLGRRSRRSAFAVVTFMLTAMFTVLIVAHLPSAEWWVSLIEEGLQWLFRR
jgi:uncharacterized membrane protein YedE/YeeE